MRWIATVVALIALAPCGNSQPRQLLSNAEALKLYTRVTQLMESTGVAVPGLARAGLPMLENARQDLGNLQTVAQQNAGLTYRFLTEAQAYLALADSMPKPFPFPDVARKQFVELRESVERIESHFEALLEQKEKQLRSPDRDNLKRYAEANGKLGPASAGRPRVVFLGDSITDGWRLNEYFEGRDFVNRGISGQITGEMLGRMKADVIDLKPAAMLVLAGTNDIARGVPLSAIENNLTMIADLAEFHKIKPLFASVLPISDYHKDVNPRYEMSRLRPPATILELNRWLRAFCEKRNFVYVDYSAVLADTKGFLQADMADDGLHPNAKGYRVMAPVALAAIDRVLKVRPQAAPEKRKKRLGVL